MRALTVQQPWAWAIIHGQKDVENRTQAWGYRGPLAIHAGMRVSQRGVDHELLRPEWAADRRGWVRVTNRRAEISYFDQKRTSEPRAARLAAVMPLGAIIGVVDLVEVHSAYPEDVDGETGLGWAQCCDNPWAESSYVEHGGDVRDRIVHLVLENPRPLATPIPARGRLGLWTPDAEVAAAIREQVPE